MKDVNWWNSFSLANNSTAKVVHANRAKEIALFRPLCTAMTLLIPKNLFEFISLTWKQIVLLHALEIARQISYRSEKLK